MNRHRENVTWWLGLSREEFASIRRERERAMRDAHAVYAYLGESVPRPKSADKEFAPRPRFR